MPPAEKWHFPDMAAKLSGGVFCALPPILRAFARGKGPQINICGFKPFQRRCLLTNRGLFIIIADVTFVADVVLRFFVFLLRNQAQVRAYHAA
jgi:hypothetical protein